MESPRGLCRYCPEVFPEDGLPRSYWGLPLDSRAAFFPPQTQPLAVRRALTRSAKPFPSPAFRGFAPSCRSRDRRDVSYRSPRPPRIEVDRRTRRLARQRLALLDSWPASERDRAFLLLSGQRRVKEFRRRCIRSSPFAEHTLRRAKP